MDREKIKNFVRELLGAWDIHLGEIYFNVIFSKIDTLSDDKMNKSVELIKKYL
jgi:hypothetical protein